MDARGLNKLTSKAVEAKKAEGWYSDGGGLYLRIGKQGRRRWVFVFHPSGKRKELGLGSANGAVGISLAEARIKATKLREQVRDGGDPAKDRQAIRDGREKQGAPAENRSTVPTFGSFADEYLERMRSSWRNEKHAAQWGMTLTRYCALIREKQVDVIETVDVLRVLQPLWARVPETAQRLRGRIENVLDAAKAMGHRTAENPARWRGHLENLLPKGQSLSRGHHAALPFKNLPGFMIELRKRVGIGARALEFTILTAVRTGEVIGASWEEFDLDRAEWTVPAERMKAGKPHRVPLSGRALEIVRDLGRLKVGPHVFPGQDFDAISSAAMTSVLKRMGRTDVTVHGFRSSFRDWAAEVSHFPHEVCEMALAHAIENKAEAAYRRGDLFEKRRLLMAEWNAFCQGQDANQAAPAKDNATAGTDREAA
jgi:integrase